MKIQYFESTDTLYIALSDKSAIESRDLDEDLLIELDQEGRICAITLEHASARAQSPSFSYEHVP